MVEEISISDLLDEAVASGDLFKTSTPRALAFITIDGIRPLEPEDLMQQPAPENSVSFATKTLRTRHHKLARLIASGTYTQVQMSELSGYSPARISTLMTDPAFIDLVDQYKEQVAEVFFSQQERLADLLMDSTDLLAERMEEDPDSFTNNQLLEILKNSADRTGHGVSSTQLVKGEITASPNLIAEIKKEVQQARNGQAKLIYQEHQDEIIEGELIPSDRELDHSGNAGQTARMLLGEGEAEGTESGGGSV